MGKPAPRPLARQMMSGCKIEMLKTEPSAGATKAGLNLVDDQQRAPFPTEILRAFEEFGLAQIDARLRPEPSPIPPRQSRRR